MNEVKLPISELLRPSDHEYYHSIPVDAARPLPDRTSPPALRKALDKAHDNIRALVRENDRLRRVQLKMHAWQKLGIKIFCALLGATWAVLGWLLKLLLPYVIHGMQK